ncbi:MAG: glycosyltransferase [Anaerolineaceae bacterium]|nr:glycosyltransferase [Anaerolineaceae bacterium]
MSKHILLIADGRSAITTRWIDLLNFLGYRISLVSTYPVNSEIKVDKLFVLPVAFSDAGEEKNKNSLNKKSQQPTTNWKKKLIQNARPLMMRIRYLLGPSTLPNYQHQLTTIISEIKPNLVHALRIPYEGMLASTIPLEIPLLVSIWGNDFTLHADANRTMHDLTKKVMHRADGVLADVHRDIQLAHKWGLDENKPTVVVPGGGGILFEEIELSKQINIGEIEIPSNVPVIINPRGIRAYARSDIFFKSIPLVLQNLTDAIFLCPGMQGKPEAQKWIDHLKISDHVRLLPNLPQEVLWSLFHKSHISVSITTHDGTPNTLLESMACGCFPIAGDINSLREWITPGINGFLIEPGNPQDLADAIIAATQNAGLRKKAAIFNGNLIKAKAEVGIVRNQVARFYEKFLQ